MLSFFPRDVLDESLDLIESASEGFLTYSSLNIAEWQIEYVSMQLKVVLHYVIVYLLLD